eukprot:gnl/TRDRNA2_/TRDRNA2_162228_c1_seq1.p1 gnl/TRDRNA2_/TRDRNA2_162228_c1~~gnl/TRDRNA2_/TRDRNA2_162228_c1_seq1.p1  ORF type:complete len:112 (-),score=25.46 gnl/TRDRNA2_/TRDRNA2_162228_c1_seq1:297-602(-)
MAQAAAAKEANNPPMTPRKGKNQMEASPSTVTLGRGDAGGEGADNMLEPGTLVELVGLKTAMSFNGQSAEVLSVDRARYRYEIRLSDGSVKTVRAENVKRR